MSICCNHCTQCRYQGHCLNATRLICSRPCMRFVRELGKPALPWGHTQPIEMSRNPIRSDQVCQLAWHIQPCYSTLHFRHLGKRGQPNACSPISNPQSPFYCRIPESVSNSKSLDPERSMPVHSNVGSYSLATTPQGPNPETALA